jgi:hypothetical protein
VRPPKSPAFCFEPSSGAVSRRHMGIKSSIPRPCNQQCLIVGMRLPRSIISLPPPLSHIDFHEDWNPARPTHWEMGWLVGNSPPGHRGRKLIMKRADLPGRRGRGMIQRVSTVSSGMYGPLTKIWLVWWPNNVSSREKQYHYFSVVMYTTGAENHCLSWPTNKESRANHSAARKRKRTGLGDWKHALKCCPQRF